MQHLSSLAESSPLYCTQHMLLFNSQEGLLLTKYEMLLDNAENEDVTVEETTHFSGTRIKGLYCDSHIAINKDIETETEKTCVLAEELGVTEEFLNDALTYYKSKYGVYVSVDNYIIIFEPNIAVAELI